MTIAARLAAEFTEEMASTRKMLERVPADKLDWRSDEKSNPIGWVASHVADLPQFALTALTTDSLDIGKIPPHDLPGSTAAMLQTFDDLVAKVTAALHSASEASWDTPWTLLRNGQELFTMTRYMMVRRLCFNHLIHHRSQLCVYYRMNGIPVPALYGPSADEKM